MPKQKTYYDLGFSSLLEYGGPNFVSGPIKGAEYYGLEQEKPLQEMGADFAARIPALSQASDIRHPSDPTSVDGGDIYSGSVGSDKVVTLIDDQDSDIVYSGSWSSITNSILHFNRSYHLTFTAGAYVEYTFSGTSRIGIFAAKDMMMGKIDVYIDGTLDETVDLYGTVLLTKFSVYTKTGLNPNIEHTIKVVMRDDWHPDATGANFQFDGFEVGSMLGGTNLYQVHAAVSFAGTLSAQGYATSTFPIFAGHEFLAITGVRINDPNIEASGLGMHYTEAAGTGQNSSDTTWQNLDLSSVIPAGSEAVEIYVVNLDTAAARNAGVRPNGGSVDRYFDVSPVNTEGENGYTVTTALDADRIVEVYSEDKDDIRFRVLGYWKHTRVPKIEIDRSVVFFYDGDPGDTISVSVFALFLRS